MKVIDLLNMIANGDKLPDRVYFWDREYILDKEYNCYLHQIDGNKFIDLLDNNNDDLQCFLNDNINCIKPPKEKIKKLHPINILPSLCGSEKKRKQFEIDSRIEQLFDKVNEIIDELEDK